MTKDLFSVPPLESLQPVKPLQPSNNMIYRSEAPHYFAKGIPVMPLRPNSKVPLSIGWSNWADEHDLTDTIKNDWLGLPANNNIGLILGAKANISVVDIDIVDEVQVQKLIALLPKSPWHRRGKKGVVLAYKHNPKISTFRLIDAEKGGTLMEYLTSGTQVVLPPSIHPDTRQPYTSNVNLYDVLDDLPELPDDFESICRGMLTKAGYSLNNFTKISALSDFTPAGNRDNTMIRIAGSLSQDVLKGRISLIRAFDVLESKYLDFMEQVEGDPIDVDKHKKKLVEFIVNDSQRTHCTIPLSWSEGMTFEEQEHYKVLLDLQSPDYDEIVREVELDSDNSATAPTEAIKKILGDLARIPDLCEVDEEALLRQLAKQYPELTSFASLKRQLKQRRLEMDTIVSDPEGGEIELNSHIEVARAAILYYSQFGELRTENGVLYSWRGSHWVKENPDEFMAKMSLRYIKCEIIKRHSDVIGVYKQILIHTAKPLRQTADLFINVANGVVLQNRTLVPHHPDFGATYVMPYRYMPEKAGKMPAFLNFLKDAWGKDPDVNEKVQALQEAIAVTLTGYATRFQRAFLLIGRARTGKSVLLEAVSSLFPAEASAAVSFNKLSENRHLVSLDKKLLNVVGEISEKQRIAGDLFKAVVDGSPVSCFRLYQESFNLLPVAAHWAASNHLPKTLDSSQGFTRRWLMFKFENQIAEDKVDIHLKDKLIAEREAIFAWALEALPRLLERNTFTFPTSHRKLIAALTYQVNPVQLYLERCGGGALEFSPEASISEEDLWVGFRSFYMSVNGNRLQIDMPAFRQMVEEIQAEFKLRIEEPKDSLHAIYHGVGLIIQG